MGRPADKLPPDHPMGIEELNDLRRRLSQLSPHHVSIEYQKAYMDCRMFGNALPPARAIQELVQIYKQLWKWRNQTFLK
jgi:hypothetical protein